MLFDPFTNVARDARILIVDDMQANVTGLSQILARAGYAICISVTDPLEALDKFPELRPDLLLLDWHMEPVSGLEFIEQLKTRLPAASLPPIIVLTADVSPATRREALAVGASDFLAKPLDPSEVLLRIRNLLRTREEFRKGEEARLVLEDEVRERTGQLQQALSLLRAVRPPWFPRRRNP
jgi:putative two-component system response regulator